MLGNFKITHHVIFPKCVRFFYVIRSNHFEDTQFWSHNLRNYSTVFVTDLGGKGPFFTTIISEDHAMM